MTISTRKARNTTTIRIGDIDPPEELPSLRPHPERQSFHLLHPAALSPRQGPGLPAADAPGGAAQLRLSHPARREILRQDRGLTLDRVDRGPLRLAPLHPFEERPPEEEQEDDRQDRIEEPLQPDRADQAGAGQDADHQGPGPEEGDEEAPGRRQLEPQQDKTEQDPEPPGHRPLRPERLDVAALSRQVRRRS